MTIWELEEWQDDTLFKGLHFEDWVEQEMDALNVTMDIGPEQVLVSRQDNMALGLEITNPESYATPMKTNPQLEPEMWGITLPNMNFQEQFLEQVPNPGLALPTTSPTPTLAGTILKHTVGFSDINNPVNGNGVAPCRNFGLAISPLPTSS